MGDFLEALSFLSEDTENIEGLFGEAGGFLFRFFKAEDGGVGRFIDGFVFAGGLAELFGGLGDIKDIVDDLEGEAEVVAEGGEGVQLADGRVGGHASEAQGGGEEGRGFVFVNADELGFGEVFPFPFEVEDLSADELFGAAALGKFEEDVFE